MRRLVLLLATALLLSLALAPPAWAGWTWPLSGEVITPYSNGPDPYAAGRHRGIDIAGAVGATVVAAAAGEVRFAGVAGSSGLTVGVRTTDGRYDTSYLHLSAVSVLRGQQVAEGERIGAVGMSGSRAAEPSHLHFGIRDAGSRHAYHDPLGFLPPPATAPRAPREVPVPQPAPIPLAPAPEPAPRVPAGRRVPVRHRVPAGRRVPAGHRAPRVQRVPAPSAREVPEAEPPAHNGLEGRRAVAPGAARPAAGPNPASNALATAPGRDHEAHQRANPQERFTAPRAGAPAAHGPDIGWALACGGLLLAAGLIGVTEDGRKATRIAGDRVSGLLRPLLGRR